MTVNLDPIITPSWESQVDFLCPWAVRSAQHEEELSMAFFDGLSQSDCSCAIDWDPGAGVHKEVEVIKVPVRQTSSKRTEHIIWQGKIIRPKTHRLKDSSSFQHFQQSVLEHLATPQNSRKTPNPGFSMECLLEAFKNRQTSTKTPHQLPTQLQTPSETPMLRPCAWKGKHITKLVCFDSFLPHDHFVQISVTEETPKRLDPRRPWIPLSVPRRSQNQA